MQRVWIDMHAPRRWSIRTRRRAREPMRRIVLYGALIVMWMLWGGGEAPAAQGNPMRAPTTPRRTEPPAVSVPEGTLPALVFDAYLRFFQQVISPVDGAR